MYIKVYDIAGGGKSALIETMEGSNGWGEKKGKKSILRELKSRFHYWVTLVCEWV